MPDIYVLEDEDEIPCNTCGANAALTFNGIPFCGLCLDDSGVIVYIEDGVPLLEVDREHRANKMAGH